MLLPGLKGEARLVACFLVLSPRLRNSSESGIQANVGLAFTRFFLCQKSILERASVREFERRKRMCGMYRMTHQERVKEETGIEVHDYRRRTKGTHDDDDGDDTRNRIRNRVQEPESQVKKRSRRDR